MTKKNFKTGLSSLLEAEPQKAKKESSKRGLPEGEIRSTFLVNEQTLEALKNIAYWERLKLKQALNSALLDYIAKYESTKGKVKARP